MKEPKIIKWKKRRATNSIFINKSSHARLIHPKLQEGEAAPPASVEKAAQAPHEGAWAQHQRAAPTPRHSTCLCLNHLHTNTFLRGVFCPPVMATKLQDRHQHCSCPSATWTVLVKQPKTENTFLSFYIALLLSQEQSLPIF